MYRSYPTPASRSAAQLARPNIEPDRVGFRMRIGLTAQTGRRSDITVHPKHLEANGVNHGKASWAAAARGSHCGGAA